jgi:hypothetical protein
MFDEQKLIIDFNVDYYEVLGLNKDMFSDGRTMAERQVNSKMNHGAYIAMASKWHPDAKWVGDEEPSKEEKVEMFKKIVKAHTVLSNERLRRVYDSGSMNDISTLSIKIEIDWNKLGKYEKNSTEDKIGRLLYYKAVQLLGTDRIKSSFSPFDEEIHNYAWELFFSEDEKEFEPLTICIVNDEDEVLRLTSGEDIPESLPFKIYVFFPGNRVDVTRDDAGKITGVEYRDIVLYEGTNYDGAVEALDEFLVKFVDGYLSGDLLASLEAAVG